MRWVIQRVSSASVSIDGQVFGSIEKGYLILVGIGKDDTREKADKFIRKMINLRIFEDENGKINRSLTDVSGSVLLVSQFTLYADISHGNRPGFTLAGDPAMSEDLYNYIVKTCHTQLPHVESGVFGADMQVSLCNDGPFTIVMDDEALKL